jgi:putative methyltransferase (TIGR04325 family)
MSAITGLEPRMRVTGRRIVAAAAHWPGILQALRPGHDHCGYSGSYETFEAATRALPRDMAGIDHVDMKDIDERIIAPGSVEPMAATEYPVLFWLRQALDDGARTLLDVGGYVGHIFRQYDGYLAFPRDFRWTIFDVPQITAAGRKLAAREGLTGLDFTDAIDARADLDILFAAGSLQYMRENYLRDVLAVRPRLPRHVIVQRTPLHAQKSFATIQSIVARARGVSFCPYMVSHRGRFIEGLAGLGYRLVDSWEKERSLDVPFHPECHVGSYSGLYFRLSDG